MPNEVWPVWGEKRLGKLTANLVWQPVLPTASIKSRVVFLLQQKPRGRIAHFYVFYQSSLTSDCFSLAFRKSLHDSTVLSLSQTAAALSECSTFALCQDCEVLRGGANKNPRHLLNLPTARVKIILQWWQAWGPSIGLYYYSECPRLSVLQCSSFLRKETYSLSPYAGYLE